MNNLIKEYSEYISNLSKKRKFPTIGEINPQAHKSNWSSTEFYHIYHLSKKEIGKYLNTWFRGEQFKGKDDVIYRDEMWTVKKMDEETASCLYRRDINPISINIMCPIGGRFKTNENGEKLYQMKAEIHSIDDSSYGIWWGPQVGGFTFEELEKTRYKLMHWINAMKVINGEEFLEVCVSLGADPETKDYN